MKRLRLVGFGIAGALVALTAATLHSARSADPALWPPGPGEPRIEIFVVSHGYHSGLVLPRETMAKAASERSQSHSQDRVAVALGAVAQRFSGHRFLEIGWGDESFYRNVPAVAWVTFGLAARALFRPGNPSVVHVVGLSAHPREVFPRSDIVRVEMSGGGYARMLAALEASFARGEDGTAAEPLGPGLYGPSLFYRGAEPFHVLNVCNHWVARLLSEAGVPTAPVLATLPPGLLLDLRWRAGLVPLPGN